MHIIARFVNNCHYSVKQWHTLDFIKPSYQKNNFYLMSSHQIIIVLKLIKTHDCAVISLTMLLLLRVTMEKIFYCQKHFVYLKWVTFNIKIGFSNKKISLCKINSGWLSTFLRAASIKLHLRLAVLVCQQWCGNELTWKYISRRHPLLSDEFAARSRDHPFLSL